MDRAGDSAGHTAVGTLGIMRTMRLWETLVRVTFGTFMGGLVLLLILFIPACRSFDARKALGPCTVGASAIPVCIGMTGRVRALPPPHSFLWR